MSHPCSEEHLTFRIKEALKYFPAGTQLWEGSQKTALALSTLADLTYMTSSSCFGEEVVGL